MKIVLNRAYGGFCLPLEYADPLGLDIDNNSFEVRTDPKFIEYVTANPWYDLRVIEFPDEATDFDIQEYDGYEELIYVIDGKIHYV